MMVVTAANHGNGIRPSAEAADNLEERVKSGLQMQVPIYPAVDFKWAIAIGRGNKEQAALLEIIGGNGEHFVWLRQMLENFGQNHDPEDLCRQIGYETADKLRTGDGSRLRTSNRSAVRINSENPVTRSG